MLQLANALRGHGVDVELDQYHVRPATGWPRWCEEQLRPEAVTFVLVICTETYRQRVEGKSPADEGRGVFWEGGVIYNYLYSNKGSKRFIPVLLPGATEQGIPVPLQGDTRYHVAAFDLNDAGYVALYRELSGQPAVIKPALGLTVPLSPRPLPDLNVSNALPARQVLTDFVSNIPVYTSRIDKYAPEELIGREAETRLLEETWEKAQRDESGRPRVLTFVALGGEGKTSLVAKWAADLAFRNWPGCDRAFAWSFYSQGTQNQSAASSDLFLKEALTFFGDPEMADSAQGAYEKGRRLAQLVGEKRALLILDGVEPLQYAPTSPTPGELKDQDLSVLLKRLAANNNGLCVVTTRYSISDLKAYRQSTAPEVNLLRLSKEAGVELLERLGVKGTQTECERLVEDVKGHALTLNLLGTWLRDAYAGDIRKRDLVKLEEADEEQGGHAFRVMDAYVRWFASEGKHGKIALALLRLMGLFDRPADARCLKAVRKAPLIPNLTEPLAGISEAHRNIATTRLQNAKLLTVNRDAAGTLLSLDAHPLLREYFAKYLREQHPEAWRAAHRRLYEHLCTTTQDKPQPTLEDLQPLYQAVSHGCLAAMYPEALEVYRGRVLQGEEFYSSRKLGAFGSDLGAVICFFDHPWSGVTPKLREAERAWVVNDAAWTLRALGRLAECIEPMRRSIQMFIDVDQIVMAAKAATTVSHTELALGEVALALTNAEKAVAYAEQGTEIVWRIEFRADFADALHQAGNPDKAEALFREAEDMQARDQPSYPLLYLVGGFLYCDLLLAAAECAAWRRTLKFSGILQTSSLLDLCRAVSARAEQTLLWAGPTKRYLEIALDHLTLSRGTLYAAILEGLVPGPLSSCHEFVENAVAGLHMSAAQHHVPRGLLTRTWLRCLTGAHTGHNSAQEDLDEAWEIAERGPMPLFLADIHLYRARLFGLSQNRPADYPWESPQHDLRGGCPDHC